MTEIPLRDAHAQVLNGDCIAHTTSIGAHPTWANSAGSSLIENVNNTQPERPQPTPANTIWSRHHGLRSGQHRAAHQPQTRQHDPHHQPPCEHRHQPVGPPTSCHQPQRPPSPRLNPADRARSPLDPRRQHDPSDTGRHGRGLTTSPTRTTRPQIPRLRRCRCGSRCAGEVRGSGAGGRDCDASPSTNMRHSNHDSVLMKNARPTGMAVGAPANKRRPVWRRTETAADAMADVAQITAVRDPFQRATSTALCTFTVSPNHHLRTARWRLAFCIHSARCKKLHDIRRHRPTPNGRPDL